MIEGQNTPDQGSIRAERAVSAQIEPRKNQGRRPSRSRRISQIFLSRKIWAAKWDAFQHPANRRLKKSLQKRIENGQCESSFVAEKDFVKYHLDVIDGATAIESDDKDQLKGIELLSRIQHNGGATLLTDFTKNFLVALWFASGTCDRKSCKGDVKCGECTKPECDAKMSASCGGRIFVVEVNSEMNRPAIQVLKNDVIKEKKVEELLFYTCRTIEKDIRPLVWFWEPRDVGNKRVRAQASTFLFGLPSFDRANIDYSTIVVLDKDKDAIRKELKSVFNISAETLFPDLPGYSQIVNGEGQSYNMENCITTGKSSLRNGSFSIARTCLEHAISCVDTRANFCAYKSFEFEQNCVGKLAQFHYWLGLAEFRKTGPNDIVEDSKELKEVDFARASMEFEKTIRLADDANDDELRDLARVEQVQCLYGLKDYRKALQVLEKIVRKRSNYFPRHFQKVELLLLSGDEGFRNSLHSLNISADDTASQRHVDYLKGFFDTLHSLRDIVKSEKGEGVTSIEIKIAEACEKQEQILLGQIKAWNDDATAIFDGRIYWDFRDVENWIDGWNDTSASMRERLKRFVLLSPPALYHPVCPTFFSPVRGVGVVVVS